jgi:SAM-dependent methyltransferase
MFDMILSFSLSFAMVSQILCSPARSRRQTGYGEDAHLFGQENCANVLVVPIHHLSQRGGIDMSLLSRLLGQCRRPRGPFGRFLAKQMNRAHGPMTAWVLSGLPPAGERDILDVGCGGGGGMKRLAGLAPDAVIHGIDYSPDSLQVAAGTLEGLIARRRVFLHQGSVSALPFDRGSFDLVMAIESHYFWPDIPVDLAELRRVLRPGGRMVIGGGLYSGGRRDGLNRRVARSGGMHCPSLSELKQACGAAGFIGMTSRENRRKGWFSVTAESPD